MYCAILYHPRNIDVSPPKASIIQSSCREKGEEEASMTTDALPVDYDELGSMDSWTNDVRETDAREPTPL